MRNLTFSFFINEVHFKSTVPPNIRSFVKNLIGIFEPISLWNTLYFEV